MRLCEECIQLLLEECGWLPFAAPLLHTSTLEPWSHGARPCKKVIRRIALAGRNGGGGGKREGEKVLACARIQQLVWDVNKKTDAYVGT